MVPDEMEDLYIAVAAELKVNHTDFVIALLQKVQSDLSLTRAQRSVVSFYVRGQLIRFYMCLQCWTAIGAKLLHENQSDTDASANRCAACPAIRRCRQIRRRRTVRFSALGMMVGRWW